jgi:hypothetical protein
MKPALQLKRSGRADPHRPPLGSVTVLTCGVGLKPPRSRHGKGLKKESRDSDRRRGKDAA